MLAVIVAAAAMLVAEPLRMNPESVFEVAAHLAEQCEIEVKVRGRAALPDEPCPRAIGMTNTAEWQSAFECQTERCADLAERYNEALGRIILLTR